VRRQVIVELDREALEAWLTKVYTAVAAKHTKLAVKTASLNFLQSRMLEASVANVISNTTLPPFLGRLVRFAPTIVGPKEYPQLRAALSRTLGIMFRRATDIAADRGHQEIVFALLEAIRTAKSAPVVRRAAVAALGEILFYIAALREQQVSDSGSDADWDLPESTIPNLIRCLSDDDEITRHYAAKVGGGRCAGLGWAGLASPA
jgi:hypothetical protein